MSTPPTLILTAKPRLAADAPAGPRRQRAPDLIRRMGASWPCSICDHGRLHRRWSPRRAGHASKSPERLASAGYYLFGLLPRAGPSPAGGLSHFRAAGLGPSAGAPSAARARPRDPQPFPTSQWLFALMLRNVVYTAPLPRMLAGRSGSIGKNRPAIDEALEADGVGVQSSLRAPGRGGAALL